MSLPRFKLRTVLGVLLALSISFGLAEQAAADAPALQTLRSPFACGTEWSGVTRAGHGLNDWNLDINRTDRLFGDPLHDEGQPLLAQAAGTVVWVGWHVSAGTYAEIDYGDITVRYLHLVDGSVPEGVVAGATVSEGQQFGQVGDSGNATIAHLHLEYFDSRDYDDARAYLLPASNQIQIAMDGEPIDPGEAFTSTNCQGEPPPDSSTTSTAPPASTTTTTTTTSAPHDDASHPFGDVDTDSFGHDDVDLLFELGITTGTGPGAYSPAATVDREQMAAFLARLWRLVAPLNPGTETTTTAPAHAFEDVDPDSFAYDDITLIHQLGITTGTSATTYSPIATVDREQMAAFLARMWRLVDPGPLTAQGIRIPTDVPTGPFEDVDPDSFAYDDISLIHQLGITTGTSATTYSPTATVDREQMAAFLARVYRLASSTDEPSA
jgi:Peptidase family M23/S-layer homology domain